jgi:hypothetical protein
VNVEVEVYNDAGILIERAEYPVKRIDHHMVFVDEGPDSEAMYCLGEYEGQFYCGADPRWRLSAKSLAECRAAAGR